MITFFTTGKPFLGHSAVIQRNALKSWTLLHPECEVILFGDEVGAQEAAAALNIRHEPHVERNEYGTKRLDYLFGKAQEIARYDTLCYVNCDILLTHAFYQALEEVRAAHREFLMVGRRRDLEMYDPYEFEKADWEATLEEVARHTARKRDENWIDYFAFSRGLYAGNIPPLVIGRVFWDHWLVGNALEQGKPVVDASAVAMAIHQNHDYGYHPQGKQGVWHGLEAGRNHRLSGGWRHLRTIADATERLSQGGLRSNPQRYFAATKRYVRQAGRALRYDVWNPGWFLVLNITRPLRRAIGWSSQGLRRVRQRL